MFLFKTAHSALWPSLFLFWPVFNIMKMFLFPPFCLLCFCFVRSDCMFPFSTISACFPQRSFPAFLFNSKVCLGPQLFSSRPLWAESGLVLPLFLSSVHAAPRGRTSWMSPEDVHVCLAVTVSALLERMCVLQFISECTWRTTRRCWLW